MFAIIRSLTRLMEDDALLTYIANQTRGDNSLNSRRALAIKDRIRANIKIVRIFLESVEKEL